MATQPEFTALTPRRLHEMQARLEELEETLRAIHHGEVDALLVSTSEGDRVFALQGADHPYRVMVETINEGAATLTPDGLILYANRRFAEMVSVPLESLIGSGLCDIVQTSECTPLDELLERAQTAPQKEECNLLVTGGELLPAYLSLTPLRGTDFQGLCLIATDLSEQKERQEELAKANEQLRCEIAERNRADNALRQLTARLLKLQDEERRRIARDLHDSTAQALTALTLHIALAQREKAVAGNSSLTQLLAKSMALAERASNEVRDLAHLLHPPNLDQIGLAAAIQWHSTMVSAVTGIEVSLDLDANLGRLPEDVEITLFRVFQESMENVRRHSGSPVATVRLVRKEETLLLEIEDHGHGAAPGVLANSDHRIVILGVGVAGMRERLRQLGGRLEIESGSQGTAVKATVPVPKAHREEGSPPDSSTSGCEEAQAAASAECT